jgi:hypothetical protein
LEAELGKLMRLAEIFVTHLKLSQRARFIGEIKIFSVNYLPRLLEQG